MDPAWIFPSHIDPLEWAGFVYIIEAPTGRYYVGRKYIYGLRGGRMVESNWRDYWGSSKPLLRDLARLGRAGFRRYIVGWYRTRAEVDYAEVGMQFRLDVLSARLADGSAMFYNRNIMGRWFAGLPALL